MLHCTPDDPKFLNLTPAQKLWFLVNIYKDKEEQSGVLLRLCQHIRPEAYFEEKASPENTSTDLVKDIEEKLGRKLTAEEKAAMGITYDLPDIDDLDEDDVDTIERI